MLGMEHTESAFLSAVQSLPIPSSALIALIAVLFLGTLVLRGQRQASHIEAMPSSSATAHPDTDRGATMSSTHDSSRTGSIPASTGRTDAAKARATGAETSPAEPGRPAQPESGEFHLHWGRTLVALVGVLAVLTALVTGVLAPLTAIPAGLPLGAAGVFLLSLIGLRTMAVLRRRSRRRARVQSAIEEAMNPMQSQPWQHRPDAGLFDALSADRRGAGGPNSLQQTDEDGLPVGLERTFGAEVQTSGPVLGEAGEPVEPWQPRSVPRPKYLDLDKAQRQAPEALEVQTPAPSSEVKLTQQRFLDPQPPVEEPAAAQPLSAPKQDSMDLDEVLKRRRA
ncbi:hypothetical protein GCM10009650_00920 [Nesterenkonia jeotgali]